MECVKILDRNNIQQALSRLVCVMVPVTSLVYQFVPEGRVFCTLFIGIVSSLSLLFTQTYKLSGGLSSADAVFFFLVAYGVLDLSQPLDIVTLINLITECCLWMSFRLDCSVGLFKWLITALGVSAFIQSIVAILQYFGFLDSMHAAISVTGCFGNPGPLGCFLSICIVTLYVCYRERLVPLKFRLLLVTIFALAFIALLLSASRAAWLAALFSIGVYCFMRYSKMLKIRYVFVVVIVFALITCGLYFYRRASADARIRIWKTSVMLANQKPLFGHGLGSFSSVYMPFQGSVLFSCNEENRGKADDVLSPYNELLLCACELGYVGLSFVLLFLGSVICLLFRSFGKSPLSCQLFPVLAYLVYGMFSYPSSEPALHLMFISVVASGIEGQSVSLGSCRNFRRNAIRMFAATIACTLATLFCFRIKMLYRVSVYCKSLDESLYSNQSLVNTLVFHDSRLLHICAQTYLLFNKEEDAIAHMNREVKFVNTSRQQLELGKAYERLGLNDSASKHFVEAHRMRPDLVEPVYAQFKLALPDTANACKMAALVIAAKPRIINARTRSMKNEARRFLMSTNQLNK